MCANDETPRYSAKERTFCDVILEVGSEDDQARLKAHRIVLCAARPFFFNALNSAMKEKEEGVIRLKETNKAVMDMLTSRNTIYLICWKLLISW